MLRRFAPRGVGGAFRRLGRTRLFIFLAVMGPGLITAASDNDAGGITTWSVVGAKYGYGLLWVLLLITPILAVTQEMGARMGAVTGKGLAALIRERFSMRLTAFAMLALLIANFGTSVSEFSGIAAAFGLARRAGLGRRAAGGHRRLAARHARQLQTRAERVSLPHRRIRSVRGVGLPGASRLACRRDPHRRPERRAQHCLADHGHRRHRHDHHPVGPVLHPGLRGRQAHLGEEVRLHQARGLHRGDLHGRDRPLHRRRLRRDAVHARHRGEYRARRRPRSGPAGRPAGQPAVRYRPAEREHPRGMHPATGDRLRLLRSLWPGGKPRPVFRRGADLQLAC